jgi:Zn-dependent protease with chaperone function
MYEFLGISLVLAGLLTINALASLVAVTLWRVLAKPAQNWSARTRARVVFAMRVGPPALAFATVVCLVIPAYLIYEPASSGEVVSKKLGAVALISFFGVALALWRGLKSWRATRALLRQWLNAAHPITIANVDIPTFCIDHPFPVIAVVGCLRPRLFVARRVLETLSDEEMRAAIAHESGHLEAHDNLRRIMIRACKDVLTIVPCGRSLDRVWSENAEAAADEAAARQGTPVALNLASALIEIARMVPAGARPTMPLASFLLGDENSGVKARVRRLIALAGAGVERAHPASSITRWAARSALISSVILLILMLVHSSALVQIHNAIESAVRILS